MALKDRPAFTTKGLEPLNLPPLPKELIELAKWLHEYYPSSIGSISQLFLPASLPVKHIQSIGSIPPIVPTTKNLHPLTPEQKGVVSAINKPSTYLLHGRTGSGKTRIYIELALRSFLGGLSSIILTPEISLTPQLLKEFTEVFGERVVLTHSHLTPQEKQKAWLKALKAREPLIIIGPRSATFAPISKLGLIIIDESHETSYKHEQAPHYHTTRAASQLTKLHQANLVLGSATPSVIDYFMAQHKARAIIRLNSLPLKKLPAVSSEVEIIDLKDRQSFTKSPYLSDSLIGSISRSIANNEQSLLYLNRRGTAKAVLCEKCGWQAVCPIDHLPLTYHKDKHTLLCHTCGFKTRPAAICPECNSTDIVFKSIGTKAVVDEVSKLFPKAKIKRFDTDNTKSERFENSYEEIKTGETDIIIGTQLIAKGLDLPKLSTVGVIIADTSTYLPDFSSQERTYQLLRQALGRVNRGHLASRAIVQTYTPTNPIIRSAINDDWSTFYNNELTEREKFRFPPYYHLLKLVCERASSKSAEKAATDLKDKLIKRVERIQVEGPSPCFHEKSQNKYRWQVVVKSTHRKDLLSIISTLPPTWKYDIDPINLL